MSLISPRRIPIYTPSENISGHYVDVYSEQVLRKPLSTDRVRVNWEHPLNKGLQSMVVMNPHYNTSDFVANKALTWAEFDANDPNYKILFREDAVYPQMGSLSIRSTYPLTGMVTLHLIVSNIAYGVNRIGVINTYLIGGTWPDGTAVVMNGGVKRSAGTTDLTTLTGKISLVYKFWAQTSCCDSVYVNGKQEGELLNYGYFYYPDGTFAIGLVGGYGIYGIIHHAELWNRLLPDAEIAELAKHPYGTSTKPRFLKVA